MVAISKAELAQTAVTGSETFTEQKVIPLMVPQTEPKLDKNSGSRVEFLHRKQQQSTAGTNFRSSKESLHPKDRVSKTKLPTTCNS